MSSETTGFRVAYVDFGQRYRPKTCVVPNTREFRVAGAVTRWQDRLGQNEARKRRLAARGWTPKRSKPAWLGSSWLPARART